MEEEEDDMYAPDEGVGSDSGQGPYTGAGGAPVKEENGGNAIDEGEEEGEEVEEDESDSDIDIITEAKDGAKPEPIPAPQRFGGAKSVPVKKTPADGTPRSQASPALKTETSAKATPPRSGASYPAIKTSKIDVDAKPIYEPNGKPITEINMDTDFPEDDKPWRRPGSDITDYFNYGFDEFTWASYCLKQDSLRKEVSDQKKQMEEMQNFLGMPGGLPTLPGMPVPPGGAVAGMPSMGGSADMPPEMQQMMGQMIQQGIDPMQMDPAMFMQQMQQMMAGGQVGPNGSQVQGFGGGQAYAGQGQNSQQMAFGFGAGNQGGGGGVGGRNQGGRGQGRRNW